MLIASLYYPFYLFLITILTFSIYRKYKVREELGTDAVGQNSGAVLLVVFLTFFIGLRPVSGYFFVDMANYVEFYHALYEGVPFSFDWHAENLLFDNYFAWVGSMSLGTGFFFTTIAAIYFGAAYLGIKKLFPNDTLAAYIVLLGAFSTFSYGTNGVKAGAAASLFILAIAYREKLKICIPLVLISLGFHHSMQLPVAAFLLSLVFRNPKVYFAAWCACILISAAHITFFQDLFAGISADTLGDSRAAEYLQSSGSDWGGKSGFRIDFIIYSAMPVLVGYWAMYKKRIRLSKLYSCLLNVYLCTNGIWMLCMYSNFTNRIAYLSWFLYPVVLIYPFLNEDWGQSRYRTFAKVMLAHLGFTIFMEGVYYGSLLTFLKYIV